MKIRIKDIFPIVILIILPIIFFGNIITFREIFITPGVIDSDTTNLNYPFRNLLAQSLKQGKIPLWTAEIYNGFPVLAEGQGGFFYPLNLLLFLLLPAFAAYNCSVVLTFLLAGVFTYLYARLINLSKYASLLAGIIFMFSGFFVSHIRHLNMINAACWIPFLFFLIEKFIQKSKMSYVVLAGVVFGFQILSGHPQIAYYSISAVGIYFLFRAYKIKLYKFILIIVIIAVIGAALAAVQWMPTYELTRFASRQIAKGYQTTGQWSYKFNDLIMFISPFYYGNPAKATFKKEGSIFWENYFYVGLLPLFLSLISIISIFKKNVYVKTFTCLILLTLVFVLGKSFPLIKIFHSVVLGFGTFRIPQRSMVFVGLGLAVLAGSGAEVLRKGIQDKLPLLKRLLLPVIVMIVITNLLIFNTKQNATYNTQSWLSKPDTVKFLEKDSDYFRINTMDLYAAAHYAADGWSGDLTPYLNYRNMLSANSNMIYAIPGITGRSSLAIERFTEVEGLLSRKINISYKTNTASIPVSGLKMIGLQNGKYIISFFNLESPHLKLRMQIPFYPGFPPIKVYENSQFMPRVFIVPQGKILTSREQILHTLGKMDFDPWKTVILEKSITHGSYSTEGSSARITTYSAEEVLIDTDLTDDGFLFLSDTHYPGWKVFIDDKEGEILQANYLFRAVALKKGRHKVRFVYKPMYFKAGAGISLLTFLLLVVYFALARRRYV